MVPWMAVVCDLRFEHLYRRVINRNNRLKR